MLIRYNSYYSSQDLKKFLLEPKVQNFFNSTPFRFTGGDLSPNDVGAGVSWHHCRANYNSKQLDCQTVRPAQSLN